MNKTILCGRIGADPELRGSVLKLRLATRERRKDKDGLWSDHTEWHAVVVFGKRAEALSRMLGKGSRILVEGKLRTSKWEQDGQKRNKTEIAADDVELLDDKRDAEGSRPAKPIEHQHIDWGAVAPNADDLPF